MTDRGPYIVTSTGIRFYPLDPRPEEIDVRDIAHHLSNICRFTGATRFHYSVAQHSCLVSDAVPREHALDALCHDGPEAYIADLSRPLKRDPELGERYRAIEARLEAVIVEALGLGDLHAPEIIEADRAACMAEKRDLMPPAPLDWGWYDVPPLLDPIIPCTPRVAESRFLMRFRTLWNRRAA